MAKENGGLYLPLSIDLSAWEQSLAAADADLQKSMREMRASMKDMKLRYDVEIAGAKAAGNDAKALELETAKLNRTLDEQRRVVEALNRAYRKSVQEKGADAQASNVLAKQLVTESKQLDKLQAQIARRGGGNTGDVISNALQAVSPRAAGAQAAISGITETLTDLGGNAAKVGGALAKFGGYAAGVGLVASAFAVVKKRLDETRASILTASENTYKLIEHLSDLADTTQLSIDEVTALGEACKVTGANLDTVAPALNRLDKAILNGDKTLENFGIRLTDSGGNLLDTSTQLQILADAYSRLKSEGRGAEFVAQLGKQAGALLPLISRLGDADFANVQQLLANAPKVGTMLEDDAKYLGELDRALAVLDERLAKAKGAEATQFKIQAVLRDIEDATEEMQLFNETASARAIERSGISALDDELNSFDSSIRTARSSLSALISETQGYLAMRLAYGIDSIRNNTFEDFDDYKQRKQDEQRARMIQRDNDRINAALGRMQKNVSVEDFSKRLRADIDKNYANADIELREQLYTQKVQEYAKQREDARKKEAEAAAQATADLRKQLRDITASEVERQRNAINDRYEKNAKTDVVLAEQIRQAELQKLQDKADKERYDKQKALEERLTELTATEQQKRLNVINKEYEQNAQTDAVMAERIRQEEIRKLNEDTAKARTDAMDKIRSIINTDYQNRLAQIEQEKQAWIKAGADKLAAEQAAQKQIQALQKQTRDAAISEAAATLQNNLKFIRYIQAEQKKGTYTDEGAREYANKLYMKQYGIKQSDIDALKEITVPKLQELADARGRLFKDFAPATNNVSNAVTINFDNTVVDSPDMIHKLAEQVAGAIIEVVAPVVQRGETNYGY